MRKSKKHSNIDLLKIKKSISSVYFHIFEGLAIQNPPRNPGISTLVGQGMLKPSPPQGAPPQPQPTPPTLGQQPSMGPQAVVRPGQCPEPNKLYNY